MTDELGRSVAVRLSVKEWVAVLIFVVGIASTWAVSQYQIRELSGIVREVVLQVGRNDDRLLTIEANRFTAADGMALSRRVEDRIDSMGERMHGIELNAREAAVRAEATAERVSMLSDRIGDLVVELRQQREDGIE